VSGMQLTLKYNAVRLYIKNSQQIIECGAEYARSDLLRGEQSPRDNVSSVS